MIKDNAIFSYFNDIDNISNESVSNNEADLFDFDENREELIKSYKMSGIESAANVISNIIVREYNLNNNALNDINIQDIFGIPSLESVGLEFGNESKLVRKLTGGKGINLFEKAKSAFGLLVQGFRNITNIHPAIFKQTRIIIQKMDHMLVNNITPSGKLADDVIDHLYDMYLYTKWVMSSDDTVFNPSSKETPEDTMKRFDNFIAATNKVKDINTDDFKKGGINKIVEVIKKEVLDNEKNVAIRIKAIEKLMISARNALKSLPQDKADDILNWTDRFSTFVKSFYNSYKNKNLKELATRISKEASGKPGAESIEFDFNDMISDLFGTESTLINGTITQKENDFSWLEDENLINHAISLENVVFLLEEAESEESLIRDMATLDTALALESIELDIEDEDSIRSFFESDSSIFGTEGAKLDKFKEGAKNVGKVIWEFIKKIGRWLQNKFTGLSAWVKRTIRQLDRIIQGGRVSVGKESNDADSQPPSIDVVRQQLHGLQTHKDEIVILCRTLELITGDGIFKIILEGNTIPNYKKLDQAADKITSAITRAKEMESITWQEYKELFKDPAEELRDELTRLDAILCNDKIAKANISNRIDNYIKENNIDVDSINVNIIRTTSIAMVNSLNKDTSALRNGLGVLLGNIERYNLYNKVK